MKKYLLGATAGFVCTAAMIVPVTAATLDDVMERLDSLQRDNKNLQSDNQAIRKEIAALRQKEQRSVAGQVVNTHNAASRELPRAAASAMAADLPMKSRPYLEAPRAFSWNGFYAGVHAGYGWGSNNWTLLGSPEAPGIFGGPLSPKTNGFLGGVQAGANYQFGTWVFGIEADLAYMHGKGSDTGSVTNPAAPITNPAIATSQIDWLATFTGRFGYAFDRSLLYVKGGVAAAEYKDSLVLTGTGLFLDLGTKTNTQVGWTVGAGWEYAFAPNWSAKVEYNYLDLGTTSENFSVFTNAATLTLQQEIEHKLHLVKVGVNYRF